MFTAFKTSQLATSCDHCIFCYFVDHLEPVLLVAQSNNLLIFSITDKNTLELRFRFTLWGNIQSMQACRLQHMIKDALVLAFDDAKVSIVEFDASVRDLRTVSMHCYDDLLGLSGQIYNLYPPVVRVDPAMRCIAVLTYNSHLIIIPCKSSHFRANRQDSLESYVINLPQLDEWLQLRIIDFQFLYGFNEPTLVIACEPKRTWVGRLAVKKDSCALIGISINMHRRQSPIIWRLDKLPYDLVSIMPIRHSIGGVIVFTMNSLIFARQSSAIFGVGLNGNVQQSTASLDLVDMQHLKITLDLSHAALIDDSRFVLCLKSGEIFLVSIKFDQVANCVNGFDFEKCAVTSPAECVCFFTRKASQLVFVGSRLGNSVLLKCTAKPRKIEQNKKESSTEDSKVQSHASAPVYTFELCDSLVHSGPYGQATIAPPSFVSDEIANSYRNQFDLVCTGGRDKTGCVSVHHQTVRPQIVTSIELPDCASTWTLHSPSASTCKDRPKDHALLIISREAGATVVLQTGQDIAEVDSSGFDTESSTILASNIGSHGLIIQITANSLYLLDGLKRLGTVVIKTDESSPTVVAADIVGNFAVLLTSCNDLIVAVLDENKPEMSLLPVNPDLQGIVETHCCYMDRVDLIKTGTDVVAVVEDSISIVDDSAVVKSSTNDHANEALMNYLYGGQESSETPKHVEYELRFSEIVQETYWVFVFTKSGHLQIHRLPDLHCVFRCGEFYLLPKIFYHKVSDRQDDCKSVKSTVQEIRCCNFGLNCHRTFLTVRTCDEVIFYEPYILRNTQQNIDQLRFKKLQLNVLFKSRNRSTQIENNDCVDAKKSMIVPFENIRKNEGVMICGSLPTWAFFSDSGGINLHPMDIDGKIKTFAPFSNINCPNGFLYINNTDHLRIAELPSMSFHSSWPFRKIHLRYTVHFIAYSVRSRLFVLVMHLNEHVDKIMQLSGEDKEVVTYARDENYILPEREQFFIQLYTTDWSPVPRARITMNEWENITCLKSVKLKSGGHRGTINEYIAISTVYCYNEDVNARGRIMLLEVVDVVPEPNQPLTRHKIKILCDQEEKGPVTALESISGYLIGAVGQKVFLWQYKDQSLTGVAFIDVSIYIHQLTVLRNFVIMSDILKGFALLRFQEEMRVLSYVAKDKRHLDIYSTEFLVDGNQLAFVVNDPDRNMITYCYNPEARESRSGFFMCQRSAFHTMALSTCGVRICCPFNSSEVVQPDREYCTHVNFFPTLDGGMFMVLPIPEKKFRRLQMLQNLLLHGIPHIAGLNPRGSRSCKFKAHDPYPPSNNTADLDLINEFLFLDITERKDICKRLGSSVDQVLEDISEISRQSHVF